MPKKPKESQAEQSKRFIEKARMLDCDESGDRLERELRKILKPAKRAQRK